MALPLRLAWSVICWNAKPKPQRLMRVKVVQCMFILQVLFEYPFDFWSIKVCKSSCWTSSTIRLRRIFWI
jgi:hypothetical protein